MIAALTGLLASKAPTHVRLDVQGVGYEIHIPLSTFYALPDLNHSTCLRIHTVLRDDSIRLYGFLTAEEKAAFLLLTGVSGIGPKLGLSVLSALSVTDLVSAVQTGNVEKLGSVPGIGKKSAGRIALELKDKVERLHPGAGGEVQGRPPTASAALEDARSALINLGYRPQDVSQALKRLTKTSTEYVPLKDLIREALILLGQG